MSLTVHSDVMLITTSIKADQLKQLTGVTVRQGVALKYQVPATQTCGCYKQVLVGFTLRVHRG